MAYFFDKGEGYVEKTNVPIESVSCEISARKELRGERLSIPMYTLRRKCAHGEFENIVTEVGQIRQMVTLYFPVCVNKE